MKRIIKDYPIINHETNTLRVTLSYNKGGMNYFTSCNEKRGLYLDVSPLTVKPNSVSYIGFSGTKMLVKEMARFNQKQFENFVPNDEDIEKLIKDVITRNNLEIVRTDKVGSVHID